MGMLKRYLFIKGEQFMNKKNPSIITLVVVCIFFLGGILPANVFGAGSSIEERINALENTNKRLEETVKSLELKATRAQDVLDIMNLQARYEAIHTSQESLTWMLFANRPDCTYEITHSRVIGFENIKLYLTDHKKLMELYKAGKLPEGTTLYDWQAGLASAASTGSAPAGAASPGSSSKATANTVPSMGVSSLPPIHPISTPNIIVADDGQTAKATFTSFGYERGGWCYGKYANAYIKIDGKWYIWHEKWLRGFSTSYYKSPEEQNVKQIFEWVKDFDENGLPKVDKNLTAKYLWYPGKKDGMTITAPQPYKTWTKEDENGGWWKRDTVKP
jgi:hypothetical protein